MAKKPANKNNASNAKGSNKSVKPKEKRKSTPNKKSKKKTLKKNKFHLNKNRGLGLYIRVKSLLWREYKKDYKGLDYVDKNSHFLRVVHKVYEECKTSGADCPDNVLTTKYQQIVGHLKRPEPFIDPELYGSTDDNEYWNIFNVEFELFEPYLWVKSPMILSPPSEFLISDYLKMVRAGKDGKTYKISKIDGYEKEFKQWVDWCNVAFQDVDSDGNIPYFIFSKPEWNEDLKRWETEIYICDREGKPNSFGYIPQGGSPVKDLPKTLIKKPTVSKPKEEKPEEEKPEVSKPKVSKKGQEYIDKISLLILKKESQQKDVVFWKGIGDDKELDTAIKRLKITQLMIDKLGN